MIGIRRISFDIIESRVNIYLVSVIVRHRLDGWTQIVTQFMVQIAQKVLKFFLARTRDIRGWRNCPWVIGGDFNVGFFDKQKGGDSNIRDRDEFNDLINEIWIIDVPLREHRYTWLSLREYPSLAKLNRVLILEEWESRFSLASTSTVMRPTLDHILVCLKTGEEG